LGARPGFAGTGGGFDHGGCGRDPVDVGRQGFFDDAAGLKEEGFIVTDAGGRGWGHAGELGENLPVSGGDVVHAGELEEVDGSIVVRRDGGGTFGVDGGGEVRDAARSEGRGDEGGVGCDVNAMRSVDPGEIKEKQRSEDGKEEGHATDLGAGTQARRAQQTKLLRPPTGRCWHRRMKYNARGPGAGRIFQEPAPRRINGLAEGEA